MLLLAPLLALCQAEAAEGCRKCAHRGVLDCPRHTAEERAWEDEVTHCALAARCPECAGALLIDCGKCAGGPDSARREQRAAAAAAWLAQEDPLETFLKRPLARADTSHFRIVVDARELKDGKKKVSGHEFLHRLARDLQRVAQLQDGHYGAQPGDRRSAARVWLWERQEDHAAVMAKFLHSTGGGDFKLLGKDPAFSVWTADPTFASAAPQLHGLAVHNGAHLLLSNLFREQWVGDLFAGWLDEGSAHWYEDRVLGVSTHFCVDEVGIPEGGTPRISRAAIRALLAKNQDPVLPGLLRRLSGQLTADEHALAFAFYDWLADLRPAALAPLLRGCQDKRMTADLLAELIGMNLFLAEEAWRGWVRERYPAQDPKPKRN